MGLQEELGLINPVRTSIHEAVLNIVLTSEMLIKECDRMLRPMGLTDTQFNVLMLLKHQTSDGKINQTQLGKMLLVNRSNVTGLIDRMEQAGWVKRQDQKGDRRVKLVSLTAKGHTLVEKADQIYSEHIDGLLGTLSDTEIKRVNKSLESLRHVIRASETA